VVPVKTVYFKGMKGMRKGDPSFRKSHYRCDYPESRMTVPVKAAKLINHRVHRAASLRPHHRVIQRDILTGKNNGYNNRLKENC